MDRIPDSWEIFEDLIAIDLESRVSTRGLDPDKAVRMLGLVFARPELPLTKQDILPHLAYYDTRSGDFITFYFAGYTKGKASTTKELSQSSRQFGGWSFDIERFNLIRKEVEARSKWRYSGSVDLILTNAKLTTSVFERVSEEEFEPTYRFTRDQYGITKRTFRGHISWGSAICVDLQRLLNEKAIQSVPTFFEQIFRYAETQSGIDPTWGFSDQMGQTLAGSAFKRLVLSLLPKPLKADVEKAFHFVVRDIEPDGWSSSWDK